MRLTPAPSVIRLDRVGDIWEGVGNILEGAGDSSEGAGISECPHVRFYLINIHIPLHGDTLISLQTKHGGSGCLTAGE